jgi:hypothetical protein
VFTFDLCGLFLYICVGCGVMLLNVRRTRAYAHSVNLRSQRTMQRLPIYIYNIPTEHNAAERRI